MIVWGAVLGFLPALLLFAAATYARKAPYDFPFWVWAACILNMFLIPLSFAYAVVKHRVLEIPVLLRRSARYLLVQRGSVGFLLLLAAAATLTFALSFGPRLGPGTEPLGIALGAAFGTVLVWAGSQVQRRVRERIDRAFFRSAYDARHALQDLAEKARSATSRADLAALLEHHVTSALVPRSLHVYLESREGALGLVRGNLRPGLHRPSGTRRPGPSGTTARSPAGRDMLDLPRQLASVNQLLYRSSESNRYATLFLGLYDDARRRLLFANCGHNPPIVLRRGGGIERLWPTARVLGLIEEWDCTSSCAWRAATS